MALSFDEQYRRELLILDTGPIRGLVVFHMVDTFRFESLRADLKYFTHRHSYDRCGRFISTFKRKTTSASVVAELHYWIRNTERTGQGKLWNRVYDEFRQMGMDEEVVPLLKMDPELVTRYGPVDVSIVEIAKTNFQLNTLILTVDDKLHRDLGAGLQVRHLREFREIS
jgi:hypothetical protein